MGSHTVLVTGANGYIGQRIVKVALERGYNVKGAGRSDSSLKKLRDLFPGYPSQLSTVVVSDITEPEAYKDAFADVTGVIHTASPFVLEPKDNVKDILDPAVKGSVAILEAASRYGTSVTRVVNTSSFAAIVDMSKGFRPGYTYTEKDWNPMSFDEAAKADGVAAYCASKALAEKAMWDWMDEHKPAFTLAAINPPWVFGPAIAKADINHLNESMELLWKLVDAEKVPPTDFAGFVDVRTVAEAHVRAYEKPDAGGQRFLTGTHFDYQTAADILRDEIPELRSRVPEGRPGYGKTEKTYVVDGSKAESVLGISYIPLNSTVTESLSQLLEAEKAAKVEAAA